MSFWKRVFLEKRALVVALVAGVVLNLAAYALIVYPRGVKSAGAAEIYIVYRHNLSLNKITGSKAFEVGGVLRDVGIEFGADLNTKNNAFAARKILPLAGVSASLNVTPATRPVVNASNGWGLENNNVSTNPMKRPSHAPLITPPPSTFGQVNRPVTRSTCIRSTPTIVTSCTGNCC